MTLVAYRDGSALFANLGSECKSTSEYNAHSRGALGAEVMGRNAQCWYEQDTVRYADSYALGQNDLIVLVRVSQREHEEARDGFSMREVVYPGRSGTGQT